MKPNEIDAVAHGLCEHLRSRNNDIRGCWGIGILCAQATKNPQRTITFKVHPGQPIKIGGFELKRSTGSSEKLVKFGFDKIEGRMSFNPNGRSPLPGVSTQNCNITIAISKDGVVGLSTARTECWPQAVPKLLKEYIEDWKKF